MKNNCRSIHANHLIAICTLLCLIMTVPCQVKADENTATNVGGWTLMLSISTNQFLAGDQIIVSLIVSNATEKTADINGYTSDWMSGQITPNFGSLQITSILAKTRLTIRNSSFMPAGEDFGGGVGPHNTLQFKFDLAKDYFLTNSGNYSVSFRCYLKSILEEGKQLDFNVPPLSLNVLRDSSR